MNISDIGSVHVFWILDSLDKKLQETLTIGPHLGLDPVQVVSVQIVKLGTKYPENYQFTFGKLSR